MQTSEALGLAPGTLSAERSIQEAVRIMAELISSCNVKSPADEPGIRLLLQAYNFGSGYVTHALNNGGVLLILAVFIIAVYAYFSVKKPESQNHDTSKKMENVTPKPDTDLYNSSTDTDPGTTSEDRSEESQEEEEGVPYQDSPITLSDFPEDAAQYFDQDISGIQTAIQTYALGYACSSRHLLLHQIDPGSRGGSGL